MIFNQTLRALSKYRQIHTSAKRLADLKLTFASSARAFYDDKVVKQIDVPTITGNFGILSEHVPTIACLKPGLVSVVEEDGSTKSYFVSSGILTVNSDSTVQILAEEAATLDEFDAQIVKDCLNKAKSETSSSAGEVAKAEAQIAVDLYEEIARALDGRK